MSTNGQHLRFRNLIVVLCLGATSPIPLAAQGVIAFQQGRADSVATTERLLILAQEAKALADSAFHVYARHAMARGIDLEVGPGIFYGSVVAVTQRASQVDPDSENALVFLAECEYLMAGQGDGAWEPVLLERAATHAQAGRTIALRKGAGEMAAKAEQILSLVKTAPGR